MAGLSSDMDTYACLFHAIGYHSLMGIIIVMKKLYYYLYFVIRATHEKNIRQQMKIIIITF